MDCIGVYKQGFQHSAILISKTPSAVSPDSQYREIAHLTFKCISRSLAVRVDVLFVKMPAVLVAHIIYPSSRIEDVEG